MLSPEFPHSVSLSVSVSLLLCLCLSPSFPKWIEQLLPPHAPATMILCLSGTMEMTLPNHELKPSPRRQKLPSSYLWDFVTATNSLYMELLPQRSDIKDKGLIAAHSFRRYVLSLSEDMEIGRTPTVPMGGSGMSFPQQSDQETG